MPDLIHQGGPFTLAIFVLAVLGMLGLVVGAILAGIATKTGKGEGAARAVSIGLLLCSPIPFLLGVLGTMQANQQALAAMAVASVEIKGMILAAGHSVALIPRMVGLCTSMTCLLPAALLCVFVAGRKS